MISLSKGNRNILKHTGIIIGRIYIGIHDDLSISLPTCEDIL